MTSDIITYLLFAIAASMSVSDMLKLSRFPTGRLAAVAILWGCAAYLAVRYGCTMENLSGILNSHIDTVLTLTFADAGLLTAYCIEKAAGNERTLAGRALQYYPGISMFFPIGAAAVFLLMSHPGFPFNYQAAIFGIATTATVFAAGFLLKKTNSTTSINTDIMYLCNLTALISGILTYGLSH